MATWIRMSVKEPQEYINLDQFAYIKHDSRRREIYISDFTTIKEADQPDTYRAILAYIERHQPTADPFIR